MKTWFGLLSIAYILNLLKYIVNNVINCYNKSGDDYVCKSKKSWYIRTGFIWCNR